MGETVYDSQIVGILAKMGDKGMSVQMLAKHLYNMNCSLFEDRDIDAMRRYVQQFVLRNSRSPLSLLERMERRGFYRLNPRRAFVPRQLVFEFNDGQAADEEPVEEDVGQQQALPYGLFCSLEQAVRHCHTARIAERVTNCSGSRHRIRLSGPVDSP